MSEENDYPKGEGQGYEGDGPNLRYDDFVGRIVQDPKEPPKVTLLSGYLGSSSEEGHVRLYLDEELSRYVEIPEKAIRHTQELSPEQSPLGGSLVWIDSGAEVVHGPAGSERRKATFLEGQIAQDYIGGGSDQPGGGDMTTQTRECGGGGGDLRPTAMGPGCGQTQLGGFCIPPTEQVYCRTLTGIFCTRFGPGCRRTLFEPACTLFGPNCQTAVFQQCHSIHYPCVTQNQTYCAESGFRGCSPIDFDTTIQEQFDPQADFGGGGAAAQAFGINPSAFLVACQTRSWIECSNITRAGCPSIYMARCPTQDRRCQSLSAPWRCAVSPVLPTRVNCPVESAVCGFDPAGGGGVAGGGGGGGAQAFGAEAQFGGGAAAALPTQFGCFPSQFVRCPSAVDLCPTRVNCPSRYTPCQSQLIRCPSALDACPTRFNCPSVTSPCVTQDFSCETRGRCPSAVDACPTRFGCFQTQICVSQVCQQSQACFPQGGGGGFDPQGGGGGF